MRRHWPPRTSWTLVASRLHRPKPRRGHPTALTLAVRRHRRALMAASNRVMRRLHCVRFLCHVRVLRLMNRTLMLRQNRPDPSRPHLCRTGLHRT